MYQRQITPNVARPERGLPTLTVGQMSAATLHFCGVPDAATAFQLIVTMDGGEGRPYSFSGEKTTQDGVSFWEVKIPVGFFTKPARGVYEVNFIDVERFWVSKGTIVVTKAVTQGIVPIIPEHPEAERMTVISVNGVHADDNGNVTIEIPKVDLSDYSTTEEMNAAIKVESDRAKEAEGALSRQITTNTQTQGEENRRLNLGIQENATAITEAQKQIQTNSGKIAEHSATLTTHGNNIAENENAIAAEVQRAKTEEAKLSEQATKNAKDMATEVSRATLREDELAENINENAGRIADNESRIAANESAIEAETSRAQEAEEALSLQIATNAQTQNATNQRLDTAIQANTTSIASANVQIQVNAGKILEHTSTLTTHGDDIAKNANAIVAEKTRAQSAEQVLADGIATNTQKIAAEEERAMAAEQALRELFTGFKHFVKYESLAKLEEDIATLSMQVIYLVPAENPNADKRNILDGYAVLLDDNGNRYLENMGSSDVDLSGYSTTEEMNAAIKAEGDRAKSAEQALADDIATNTQEIAAEAQRAIAAEQALSDVKADSFVLDDTLAYTTIAGETWFRWNGVDGTNNEGYVFYSQSVHVPNAGGGGELKLYLSPDLSTEIGRMVLSGNYYLAEISGEIVELGVDDLVATNVSTQSTRQLGLSEAVNQRLEMNDMASTALAERLSESITKFEVSPSAGAMVHKFQLRTDTRGSLADYDVEIDWGDGTRQRLADMKPYDGSSSDWEIRAGDPHTISAEEDEANAAQVASMLADMVAHGIPRAEAEAILSEPVTLNVEPSETDITVRHTYSAAGTYTVTVHGRDYWGLRNPVVNGVENQLTRVFETGLPIASNVTNLALFCAYSPKLVSVAANTGLDLFARIHNASSLFYSCSNLESVAGFKTKFRYARDVSKMFAYCTRLKSCDFQLPNNIVKRSGYQQTFYFTYLLGESLTSLLPDAGFDNRAVDLSLTFFYCGYDTGNSSPVPPQDAAFLWGDQAKRWTNTANTFRNSIWESNVPVSWGGTKPDSEFTPVSLTGQTFDLSTENGMAEALAAVIPILGGTVTGA